MDNVQTGPSRLFYLIAAVIFVGGAVCFVGILLSGLKDVTKGMEQLVMPGSKDIDFTAPGACAVCYEYESVVGDRAYSTGEQLPPIQLTVVEKATGKTVPVTAAGGMTYSVGSRKGKSVFAFTIPQPGVYTLTGSYSTAATGPEIVLAIDHGFTKQLLTTVLSGICIAFTSFAAAVTIAVVTLIKRIRAKRQMANPTFTSPPMFPQA